MSADVYLWRYRDPHGEHLSLDVNPPSAAFEAHSDCEATIVSVPVGGQGGDAL